MIRYGKTAAGRQRFRCNHCKKTGTKTRSDISRKRLEEIYRFWLLGKRSLSEIASEIGIHRVTLSEKFKSLDIKYSPKKLDINHKLVLVVDGKRISEKYTALFAYDYISKKPIGFLWGGNENKERWRKFLKEIRVRYEVYALVSDGQKGIRYADLESVVHQRCMYHIMSFCLSRLTQNPRTEAGKELRKLIKLLPSVWTDTQKELWTSSFCDWEKKYESFLCEYNAELKRYVHRKLRSVRSHLRNALPDMFCYISDVNIPRTTNDVEGGINSLLDELLRCHRGINEKEKEDLVKLFIMKLREKN